MSSGISRVDGSGSVSANLVAPQAASYLNQKVAAAAMATHIQRGVASSAVQATAIGEVPDTIFPPIDRTCAQELADWEKRVSNRGGASSAAQAAAIGEVPDTIFPPIGNVLPGKITICGTHPRRKSLLGDLIGAYNNRCGREQGLCLDLSKAIDLQCSPTEILEMIQKVNPPTIKFNRQSVASILSHFISDGDLKACQWLLERTTGIDIDDWNHYAHGSPLMQAARKGQVKICEWLITERLVSDIDQQGYKGQTALILAAEIGSLEIVRLLIKNGASLSTPACMASGGGGNALIRAICALKDTLICDPKDLLVCNELIENMSKDQLDLPLKDAYNALCLTRGMFGSRNSSLMKGAVTALGVAVLMEKEPLVTALLKKGIDPNASAAGTEQEVPLTMAVKIHKGAIAEKLLDCGADWNLGQVEIKGEVVDLLTYVEYIKINEWARGFEGVIRFLRQKPVCKKARNGLPSAAATPSSIDRKVADAAMIALSRSGGASSAAQAAAMGEDQDASFPSISNSFQPLTTWGNGHQDNSQTARLIKEYFDKGREEQALSGLDLSKAIELRCLPKEILEIIQEINPPKIKFNKQSAASILSHFISHGNLKACQWLFERTTDMVIGDWDHYIHGSPLMQAANRGKVEICKWLIAESLLSNIDQEGYKGQTALILAAEIGSLEIVRLLIENGASLSTPVCMTLLGGGNALIRAIYNQHTSVCDELIENMSKEQLNLPLQGAHSALFSIQGISGLSGALLSKGAITALGVAVLMKNKSVVTALLKKGCDANASAAGTERQTPLTIAVKRGAGDIAKMLLDYGANWNLEKVFKKYGDDVDLLAYVEYIKNQQGARDFDEVLDFLRRKRTHEETHSYFLSPAAKTVLKPSQEQSCCSIQ